MRVSDYMSVLTVKPLLANQPDQPGIEFSLTGNLVYTWDFSTRQSNFLPCGLSRIFVFKPTSSVADPEPNPGRYAFGPHGSGSISTYEVRYGSGSRSFYDQAKIVRKTLIPTVLWLPYDFLSLKNDVNDFEKQVIFCCHLEGHWQKYQDPDPNPDPLVRGTVRIRGSRSGSVSKCHGSATLPTS